MDPINYDGAFTSGLQSPLQAFTQGLQGGALIKQVQAEQAAQAAAAAQKQQMEADLAALSANPTPQAIAQASLKYPQLSEQFKRSYDMLAPAQQQARLAAATPIHAAILSGEYGIAASKLREQATAYENSGSDQEAKQARAMADLIEQHPENAKLTTGLLLSSVLGPEKYAETFGKLGQEQRAQDLHGDAVRKGAAEADTAVSGADSAKSKAVSDAVGAKYAEPKALLELEGIKTDIQYKKDQTKIAYLNAKIVREGNEIQKQKLQLDLEKAVTERDEKMRGKVADAESAAGNIDNMLNTIERIRNNGSLDSVLGSLEGKDYYPNTLLGTANPFGDGDERADAIRLIDTLGSQAFLSQIPNIKGMGALSNAEGEKLQAAFQNLSRAQSEKQFRATLDEATRLLNKGRSTVSKRFGVPLGNPDTPAKASSRPPLSSFGGQ